MSRSGYSDAGDGELYNLYRGSVARSLRGRRGERALVDMLAALDAMPIKKLSAYSLATRGQCALGALAAYRDVEVSDLDAPPGSDPTEREYAVERRTRVALSERLDISITMVSEVVFENDEGEFRPETDTQRWVRMRHRVSSEIITKTTSDITPAAPPTT